MRVILAIALTSIWLLPLLTYFYRTFKREGNSAKLDATVDVFAMVGIFWFIVSMIGSAYLLVFH